MLPFENLFIGHADLLNAIRIMSSPELRSATRVYCRSRNAWGNLCFGSKLRVIPDQYYARFRNSNFCDQRASTTIHLTKRCFEAEQNRYWRRYAQQAVAMAIYDAVGLVQDQELLTAELAGRSCVLIPFTPLLTLLREGLEDTTRCLRWGFGRGRILKALRRALSHVRMVARAVAGTLVRIMKRDSTRSSQPTLSVLNFRGGLTVKQRTDFFWLDSLPAGQPIIFEYGQTAYPLSDQYIAELRDLGIRIVETHGGRKKLKGSEKWEPSTEFLTRSFRSLVKFVSALANGMRSRSFSRIWEAIHRFQFDMQVNARGDFYRRYNVRAELISGFTLTEPAHSCALQELGGITCTAQYSVGIDPLWSHTSTSTVHLHFGDGVTTWGFPFLADYNVLNGYLFKTPLSAGAEPVEALRHRMAESGIAQSICFMDEGFHQPDLDRMTYGFGEYLLHKILDKPDFGVVIKPKKENSIDCLRAHFGHLFDAAMSTGRLFVLDRNHYPGLAGLAANLTVGLLSSAPFEAALMRGRAIYLNPFGYLPSFMSEIKGNTYESLSDAITAVECFLNGQAEQDFGRHPESFITSIDSLRDEKVSDRIRYILFTYLARIRNGDPPELAKKETMSGLSQRWPVRFLTDRPSAWITPLHLKSKDVQCVA